MVMYLSRLDPIGYWRADASMSRVQSNFIVCPQVVGTTKPVWSAIQYGDRCSALCRDLGERK